MNMKKITLLLVLCAGIWISSCDKYLDIQPANVKAVGSMEDIRGMLGGYLQTVANLSSFYFNPGHSSSYSSYWYDDIGFMMDAEILFMFSFYEHTIDRTEILLHNSSLVHSYSEDIIKALNWSSIETHGNLWDRGYKTIGLMNRILEEVAALNEPDSELKQQIVGEARVVRAWCAFKLLQYFAPFTNDALGIPLKFDTEDLASNVSLRKTQTEVYEMILTELKEVLAYTAPTDEGYNIFYRKGIINGILAQLYTYKATGPVSAEDDWANARMHAMVALEGRYLATSSDELKSLFASTETKADFENPHAQISFFWDFNSSRPALGHQWGSPSYRDRGFGDQYAGRPFHSEYLALFDEDDFRMEEGMFIWNKTYNENNKWIMVSYPIGVVYQMLRTAEMHLIVAESYAREGDDGNAKQWLDSFKASRNTTYYASTDILAEILNERTKEFATEYDIVWLDLKRNEMSITHEFVDPLDGPQTLTLESNDYRFAFYIPIDSELSVNANLEQNPGWAN